MKKEVNHIFNQYVQTQELKDLKEEIMSNLQERVNENLKAGATLEEAEKNAMEAFGDMEQIVSDFPKKAISILTVINWGCIGSCIFGIISALLTFIHYGGFFGGFLAIGTLYPFVILQSTYMVWYYGRNNRKIWNIITAVLYAFILFMSIDIAENWLCMTYYNASWKEALQTYSFEILADIMAVLILLFIVVHKNKKYKKK